MACRVVLLMVCAAALLAAPSVVVAQGETSGDDDVVVYVPIENAVIEEAPAPAPNRVAGQPEAAKKASVEQAKQAVSTSAKVVVSGLTADVGIPGLPLWWLLLVLLAVPLARLWRRWTAKMFV